MILLNRIRERKNEIDIRRWEDILHLYNEVEWSFVHTGTKIGDMVLHEVTVGGRCMLVSIIVISVSAFMSKGVANDIKLYQS